jgi:hypothetical protein
MFPRRVLRSPPQLRRGIPVVGDLRKQGDVALADCSATLRRISHSGFSPHGAIPAIALHGVDHETRLRLARNDKWQMTNDKFGILRSTAV